jgi:hypothetical protein
MSETARNAIAVIGIDIGKNSFHVVGRDYRGAILLRQRDRQPCLQTAPKGTYSTCMINILDTGRVSGEEPNLIVRKASHAPIWSVWAMLEGIPSEEIFEGSSEEEASSWINTGGRAWLEERRRKRKA